MYICEKFATNICFGTNQALNRIINTIRVIIIILVTNT